MDAVGDAEALVVGGGHDVSGGQVAVEGGEEVGAGATARSR